MNRISSLAGGSLHDPEAFLNTLTTMQSDAAKVAHSLREKESVLHDLQTQNDAASKRNIQLRETIKLKEAEIVQLQSATASCRKTVSCAEDTLRQLAQSHSELLRWRRESKALAASIKAQQEDCSSESLEEDCDPLSSEEGVLAGKQDETAQQYLDLWLRFLPNRQLYDQALAWRLAVATPEASKTPTAASPSHASVELAPNVVDYLRRLHTPHTDTAQPLVPRDLPATLLHWAKSASVAIDADILAAEERIRATKEQIP